MEKAWATFGARADVQLVDVGAAHDGRQAHDLAIRIHTSKTPEQFRRATAVPAEIDGVPVVVVTVRYRLER
jgi:hypothetical protein